MKKELLVPIDTTLDSPWFLLDYSIPLKLLNYSFKFPDTQILCSLPILYLFPLPLNGIKAIV